MVNRTITGSGASFPRLRLWLVLTAIPALSLHAQTPILIGATATQAVVRYTSPSDAPCQIKVTETDSLQSVPDTDPALFAGANLDNRLGSSSVGRSRLIVLGRRNAEKALNNRYASRALQAFTPHTLTVTCPTGTPRVLPFITANPPAGSTYPELPATAPDTFGRYAWPQIDWTNRQQKYVDPMTGVQLKLGTGPGDYGVVQSNVSFAAAFDPQQGWTNLNNAINPDGQSVASTSSTKPLFLALGKLDIDYQDAAGFGLYSWSVDDLRERLRGFSDDADPNNRAVNVCLSVDSGQTCATDTLTLFAQRAVAGSIPLEIPSPAVPFPAAPFQRWGNRIIPRQLIAPSSGAVTVAGHTMRLSSPSPALTSYFNLNWPANSKIYLAGSAPSCPNNFCTISSVTSSVELELVELPTITASDYRAANFGLLISKKTSTGALFLRAQVDLAGSKMFNLPFTGTGDICSPHSDTVSVSAVGLPLAQPLQGNLCVISSTSAQSALYFFIPATGELRLLSTFNRAYDPHPLDGGGGGYIVLPNSFDPVDPRVIYGLADTGNSTIYYKSVFRGRYTGDYRALSTVYTTTSNDQMVWTNLTPKSQNRDLGSQLAALRPDYHPEIFPYINATGVMGRRFIFSASSGQDNPCLVGLVDLQTGNVSVKDSWSQYPGRWGTCHAIQPLGSQDWMIAFINPARYSSPGVSLAGPWRTPVIEVFKNQQWNTDTTLSRNDVEQCPADLPLAWQQLGATGNQCVRIRVAGEPCSPFPSDRERTLFPCPYSTSKSLLQPLAEGDILIDLQISVLHEQFRIVRKTVIDPQKIELVLQRRASCSQDVPLSFFDHSAGWGLNAVQNGGCYASAWWLNLNQPETPWLIDDPALTSSHNDIGPSPTPQRFSSIRGPNRVRFDQNIPTQIGKPFAQLTPETTAFAGSTASIRESGFIETYPSSRQWNAPPSERGWAMDFHAYQAGLGLIAEAPLNLFTPVVQISPGFSHVYLINTPNSSFDRKRVPYLAWAGRNLLRDISGPGSRITDSDLYSFCVADKAGECVPGSIGQNTYINVPQISIDPGSTRCVTNHYASNYPCVVTANPLGAWAVQWDTTRPDFSGGTVRRLTMALSGPGRQYTFANSHPTPDGKWAWLPGYWLDGYRTDLLLVKLPPWPWRDNLQRQNFQPVKYTIQAMAGASYARVRFGYAENGPVESFYCTARQESCTALGSINQSDPFAWISEANSSIACSTGCVVELPAISGRVMYYRVERLNSTGGVIATGPVEALPIQ